MNFNAYWIATPKKGMTEKGQLTGYGVSKINLCLSETVPKDEYQIASESGMPAAYVRQHLQSIEKDGMAERVSSPDELTEVDSMKKQVEALEKKFKEIQRNHVQEMEALEEAHQTEIENLKKQMGSTFKKIVVHRPPAKKKTVLKDITLPSYFDHVMDLVGARRPVLLIGPAGCGKSFLGPLLAQILGFEFGTNSCTLGMSESELFGSSTPNIRTGKPIFSTTEFIKRYEEGGVYLLDEIDAADNNVLLKMNAALTPRGICNVPKRFENPYAERHEDFVIVATANTIGRGANRMYAGRNQLDEATLDRFRIGTVVCDFDQGVERALCPEDSIRIPLQELRGRIERAGLRRVLSSRFMEDAYQMHTQCDWDLRKILEVFYEGWSSDDKAKVQA